MENPHAVTPPLMTRHWITACADPGSAVDGFPKKHNPLPGVIPGSSRVVQQLLELILLARRPFLHQ
jgi:hypothetical protein